MSLLRSRWVGMVGVVLYAASGVLYLFAGLVAPPVGVAVLWVAWLIGLVVVGMLAHKRSPWVLAGLPGAVAFWYVLLTFGDLVLGWTA